MNLPKGWARANVEELAGTEGLVSDGDWVETKDQDSSGGVRLTQLADVGDSDFRNRSSRYMTVESALRLNCTFLEPGDVLIARMPDPIGRACIFPDLARPAVTAVDVMIWRTDNQLASAEWLVRWINSPSIRTVMASRAGGTTRQRIAGGQVKQIELPLPPLAEQRRIVAKLDVLTARLGLARAELDRALDLARKIRLSSLRSVFQFDAEQVPPGWRLKQIDQIAEVQLGRQRSPKDHTGPNMRPYLRAANVTWRGWDLTDVKEMNFSPAEFDTFRLKEGDILLNEGSGSAKEVGKPVVWRGQIANICFQNTLLRVRPFKYDPDLLRYCLLYLALSGQFIANTKGVNIIHIGKAGLAKFVVPEPPKSEQKDLLERLNIAFAHADRLEAEAERARGLLDRLQSAILAKAFKGELVPQDPNDEPASVLLERIRAQRAARLPAEKAKRRTTSKTSA